MSLSNVHSHRIAALVAAVLLAACGGKEGAAGAGGAMPPPQVGVVTVQPGTVALQVELPGRVSPLRVAQVRARSNGVVLKRLFTEGANVKAGQALFKIDAAPYVAAQQSAQAQLARAEANLVQARSQAERYKPLAEANAISQQDYIAAVATQKQAEADVAASRAALETSRINLGYTDVVSPIAGRIGRAQVTEGALVSATEATLLATVQQLDTVYVDFTQSSADVLKLRKALQAQTARDASSTAVRVVLEDGTELPRAGKLLFSDLTVDATSGQITLRAEVPNANGLLLPGQYVRVRLAQAEIPQAVLLPQQAVTRNAQGDTVLVVGADNKPAPRPVKLGGAQGNRWIVLEGLQAGEKVVVDGFQKMMVPGAPVNPVPWTPPASAAASAPASAPASAAR